MARKKKDNPLDMRVTACEECGRPIEQERVDMQRVREILNTDKESAMVGVPPDYEARAVLVVGWMVIGPHWCAACAKTAAPMFKDSLKPPEPPRTYIPRPMAPRAGAIDLFGFVEPRDVRDREWEYMEVIRLKKPDPIPDEIHTVHGIRRKGQDPFVPRVKTAGKLPQNPWDRAPRDGGRRDFEDPTANDAIGRTREPIPTPETSRLRIKEGTI